MARAIQAGESGQRGEVAFADWLRGGGLVEGTGFRWVSREFAYAPYDFVVSYTGGRKPRQACTST